VIRDFPELPSKRGAVRSKFFAAELVGSSLTYFFSDACQLRITVMGSSVV
jgi:hypothetical protein